MNTQMVYEEDLDDKIFLQLWDEGRIEEAIATRNWMTLEECRRSCHEAIDEARQILAARNAVAC